MTMKPLTCDTCGTAVLVEKFSSAHTSIQWTGDTQQCPVRASAELTFEDVTRPCASLRATIDRAVLTQQLVETQIVLPRS